MTVREAILGARLERAAEALSRPNCRVSLVAEACGFGSDVSFRRMFAARYGASPKAWSEMRLKSGAGAGGGENLV
jgi:transcriptional regulator GlxA family with amidase domain